MASGGARPGSGRPAGKRDLVFRRFDDKARKVAFMALQQLEEALKQQATSLGHKIEIAQLVFDRAYGKAKQQLELGNLDGSNFTSPGSLNLATMSDEELQAYKTLATAAERDRKGNTQEEA